MVQEVQDLSCKNALITIENANKNLKNPTIKFGYTFFWLKSDDEILICIYYKLIYGNAVFQKIRLNAKNKIIEVTSPIESTLVKFALGFIDIRCL